MSKLKSLLALAVMLNLVGCGEQSAEEDNIQQFTQSDIDFLKRFSLDNLGAPKKSQSNAYADNLDAAKLGHKLFFDARFSADGKVACATCHQPEKYFSDGLKLSIAIGTAKRNAPSILTASWSHWLYWDGRKDSLWSQALAPIEHPDEHGFTRTAFVKLLAENYQPEYQKVFGSMPDLHRLQSLPEQAMPQGSNKQSSNWNKLSPVEQMEINEIFINAGKALMAYQRQLRMPESPFDNYLRSLNTKNAAQLNFSTEEIQGLRLFVGKGNCASCHNGPLLTNFEFHNIGAPEVDAKKVDLGRYAGVSDLVADEFTCLSKYSDATPESCLEMRFLKKQGPELVGAFKTPSLRNVAKTAPYMQSGQFDSLEQVIAHYNKPVPPFYDREQHPNRPHFDIMPLKLSVTEIQALKSFLETLTSPFPKDDPWWRAPTSS